jgi:hypothetical protein
MNEGTRVNKQQSSRISASPGSLTLACAMLALIALTWAVINQVRISDLHADLDSLRADNAILRENANATAYLFVPSDIAPNNLNGVAYLGTSGSGAVVISNLPPAGDNEVYRVWLVNPDDSATAAGSLFLADNGQGFALIPADASGYNRIAISLEPNGDSATPSGDFLLVAEVPAVRGEQPQPIA